MGLHVQETMVSLESLSPQAQERRLLDEMLFVSPYLGFVVASPELGEIGLWVSEADQYREYRILSGIVQENGNLPFNTGWSYGTIRASELFAAPDPLQAAVDASYHIESPHGMSTNFLHILGALHGDTRTTLRY